MQIDEIYSQIFYIGRTKVLFRMDGNVYLLQSSFSMLCTWEVFFGISNTIYK